MQDYLIFNIQSCLQKKCLVVIFEHMHLNVITAYKYTYKNWKTVTNDFKKHDNIYGPSTKSSQIFPPVDTFSSRYRGRDILLQGHCRILSMQPNDVRCSYISGGEKSPITAPTYKNFPIKSPSFSGSPSRISTKSTNSSQSLPSPIEFISLTTEVHLPAFQLQQIWRPTFFIPNNNQGFILPNYKIQQWNDWRIHTLHSYIILQVS